MPFGVGPCRKELASFAKPTPTTGSPVSRMFEQFGAMAGDVHGCTKLLTNGSSAHSEISWLSGSMSCSVQAVFGLKNPGVT